jgi:hypothetical protein
MPPREDIQRPYDPADACPTAKEAAEKIDRLRGAIRDDILAERIENDVAKSARNNIKKLEAELEILTQKQERASTKNTRKGGNRKSEQGGLI